MKKTQSPFVDANTIASSKKARPRGDEKRREAKLGRNDDRMWFPQTDSV